MAKRKAAASGGGVTVTVQANEKVIKKGGAFHDPDHEANPKAIGEKPIAVVRTTFVDQRLKAGDLVEVRGGKEKEGSKE